MAKTQDENLITFVLGDSSIAQKIGPRMHFNRVPADTGFPRIFFIRTGSSRDGCIDDAAGSAPTRENFLLEIHANDPRDAEDIRKLAEARLNCYRGAFGDTTAAAIFAEDQTSAHEPRGLGRDEGIHFAILAVEVIL